MNIDNMPAGREMDALVGKAIGAEPKKCWEILNADETATAFSAESRWEAERFLRDHLNRMPDSWLKDYHVGHWDFYKSYSTNIAAAWEVVEKLKDKNIFFIIHPWVDKCLLEVYGDSYRRGNLSADTAPLAICRASLKALGVTKCPEKTATEANE